MITSLELARQLAIYSYNTKTKDVNSIAEAAGFPPIYLITAIYEGGDKGLFTVKQDKKGLLEKIEVSDEQYEDIAISELSIYGEEFKDIAEKAIEAISWVNKEEKDLNKDVLQAWFHVSPFVWENLMVYLLHSGRIHAYTITDSKDKKSTYTFLTLPENKRNLWGHKQFLSSKKK